MTSLTCILTDAGRAALVAAAGTNAVTIAEAGLTAAAFVVAPTLTALPGEIKRIATVSGLAIDDATVHLTIRDDTADTYDLRGIGLYLDDGTLFAVYGQADLILGKSEVSVALISADMKLLDGQADLVQFGDTNFINPPASETVKGVAYLATIAEALAGAVADRIITPATMKAVLDNYVAADQLGQPNGVATLGADGKLLIAQRPPIDLVDVFAVASEAEQLALDATVGDFAVRSDNGLVYVLQTLPATDIGNWLEISTPAPVSSVNGKVGAVNLTAADVGAPPSARSVTGAGLLAGQGGDLSANRVFNLLIASAAEALAGVLNTKALTPASLSALLAQLAAKAEGDSTVTGSGLVTGGGALSDNPVLQVLAASAADVLTGTATDRAVTPAALGGLSKSLTQNGYANLPGGLLIQWINSRTYVSSEGSRYVTFPITFPNACLALAATGYIGTATKYRDLWVQQQGEASTVGCNIRFQTPDGGDAQLDGFILIMIGY